MGASTSPRPPARLRRLPRAELLGAEYPVATTRAARLLGLALLDASAAGPGLLIPRCRSVHTFGMRFPLDLYFLGRDREPLRIDFAVGPGRLAVHRGAGAVLEVPSRRRAPRPPTRQPAAPGGAREARP